MLKVSRLVRATNTDAGSSQNKSIEGRIGVARTEDRTGNVEV